MQHELKQMQQILGFFAELRRAPDIFCLYVGLFVFLCLSALMEQGDSHWTDVYGIFF
jgi:hypothetical protein